MISLWFPKAIYFQPNILNENLSIYEEQIKNVFHEIGFFRDGMKNVNSSHKTKKDIFDVASLSGLKEQFFSHSKMFLSHLGYKNSDNLKIDNCWANISYPGDYIFPHNHNGSMISGVYYIKCSIDEKIKFFNTPSMLPDPDIWNQNNYQYCEYSCIPGSILIFPSDLIHGVEKQICQEKISISFNVSL